jgi:arabinofuranosyltransferase
VSGQENSEGKILTLSDLPRLASLLAVGCLVLAAFALNAHTVTSGLGGVPLDDAWIHFQFARNLARGDGLSFNPGQPTSGSTAPLWTLLLAAVYALGGRFPAAGQVLSAASYLGMLAATYILGRRVTSSRWMAWLAGMVVAVNGRMVWAGLSALEICTFAALSLLGITAHLEDRVQRRYRLRTAALFGLAALCRPEGYLLFVLSMGSFGYYAIRNTQDRNPKSVLHIGYCALPAVGVFVILILPYIIFSWFTSGHLLPNTYHAKATISLLPDQAFRDLLSVGAVYLILDNPLLLPFFLFGLILLLRRAPLLSWWAMALPLAYAFIRASLYQHGRYLMPLIPINGVIAMWGLLEAKRLIGRRLSLGRHSARGAKQSRASHDDRYARLWAIPAKHLPAPGTVGTALLFVLFVAGTAWRLPTMADQYARNVDNINRMHVALGHWVAENTPPGTVLALNDIGAITYISERPVVDLAGLVTPEMTPSLRAPEQTDQLIEFLREQGVKYVIIFPNWFPTFAQRGDVLEEVHRVTLENRTIAGGTTMVVYRIRH